MSSFSQSLFLSFIGKSKTIKANIGYRIHQLGSLLKPFSLDLADWAKQHILNPWCMLFHSAKVRLKVSLIQLKVLLTYWEGLLLTDQKWCLFVCNRDDTLVCQDGLRTRKLCQSPMPGHCCNSRIFCGASPRCFPYTITWTEESTCNVGHGIGIWSAEWHWEADPTTAGRRHF